MFVDYVFWATSSWVQLRTVSNVGRLVSTEEMGYVSFQAEEFGAKDWRTPFPPQDAVSTNIFGGGFACLAC